MKKIILILVSLVLVFSSLHGAKKKKNINKYIFSAGMSPGKNKNLLIVFDGETKTVQRKRIGTNSIDRIFYFPKQKKIIVSADSSLSLYSIDVDNLNNFFKVNLKKFNKFGKPKNFIDFIEKKDNNHILFNYMEWNTDWNDGQFGGTYLVPKKYKQGYLWNINNNTFTKFNLPRDPWEMESDGSLQLIDDPYEANDFKLYKLTDKNLKGWENRVKNNDAYGEGVKKKRSLKRMKRYYKVGRRFKKILKKGKIDVGNYNQPSDLYFKPTGGRYMVVRNDKLYLVHMKTKKVYTLMDNPFRELNYFIIEKNEDDVDLDAK